MGWDEVTRWNSGDRKLEYYEHLVSSDEPLAVIRNAGSDSYPGLFDVSLAWTHKQTGWDRFALGHFWRLLFGMAGLGALWLAGWKVGGSRLAFWSVLFLLLIPPFYGHLFHNPKDIPFAAMYMVGLCGLIFLVGELPRLRWKWVVLAGVACGLAMAVRIAGMVLLCYLAVALVFFTAQMYASKKWIFGVKESKQKLGYRIQPLGRFAVAFPLFLLAAFCTLIPWWPAGHKNIFAVSGETLQRLHGSAASIPLFFRGEVTNSSEAPFYYTLSMFSIKTPESLLLLLVAGLFLVAFKLRGGLLTHLSKLPPASVIILLGALFPLLYLTATAPALHNGVRHFLFVYPPLALVGAFVFLELQEKLRPWNMRALLGFRVVMGALLSFQLFHLITLHPYQYVYFNQIAGGPAGAYGKFETEYWFTSTKHSIEWLETNHAEEHPPSESSPIRLLITGPWQVAEPFLPAGFELTGDRDQADYIIANTQMMMHTLFDGEIIHVTSRMGLPICLIIRPGTER